MQILFCEGNRPLTWVMTHECVVKKGLDKAIFIELFRSVISVSLRKMTRNGTEDTSF